MAKQEVELPDLPENMWWETASINANGSAYIKLQIWKRRFFLFKKCMAESEIIKLDPGPPEQLERIVKMHCDILILQLPDQMHIEVEEQE